MKQTKLLLLIMAILMPMIASADVVEIDGIWYDLLTKAKRATVVHNPDTPWGWCSGNIVIPEKVTYNGKEYNVISIGDYAFENCEGLTSVTIPNSVTSIGGRAFRRCSKLASVNIPDGVTYIGIEVFYDCESLRSVTIPGGVSNIYGWSFQNCTSLTSVTILDGVTSIDEGAFGNCGSLTSITLPNSVTSIGKYAFSDCYSLTSITLPNDVTSIGERAFLGCGSLTSVTIPNSITRIEGWTFEGCGGLKSVTIPNTVTSIGESAFNSCSSLTSVTIPNSVTYIDRWAFTGCKSLTSVTIPNSVTTLRDRAFEGCSNLATITIGTGVALIEERTFADCFELTDVYCMATDLPCESNAFEGSHVEFATLHVPRGSVDAYKDVEPWNSFGNIVEIEDAKVELSQTKATIEKGKTLKLKATVSPSDLTDKSVTWKSSNKKIATVTSAGKVKGVKAGTATITCTSKATGAKATCKVTVVNGTVTLNKTEACVQKGKTVTLKAKLTPETLEDKSVTWKSSNTKIATVTDAGKVKGVKYGTATITCTSVATGAKATCQVTVGKVIISMSEFSLKRSRTTTLTAIVYPEDLADKSVTWESSDESIATVTAEGKVKGIKAGTATITCTSVATGLKGTCTVTVLKTKESISHDGGAVEMVTGIDEVEDPAVIKPFDVYDLSGHKVLSQVTSLDGLPNGIYIVDGKKILKK